MICNIVESVLGIDFNIFILNNNILFSVFELCDVVFWLVIICVILIGVDVL